MFNVWSQGGASFVLHYIAGTFSHSKLLKKWNEPNAHLMGTLRNTLETHWSCMNRLFLFVFRNIAAVASERCSSCLWVDDKDNMVDLVCDVKVEHKHRSVRAVEIIHCFLVFYVIKLDPCRARGWTWDSPHPHTSTQKAPWKDTTRSLIRCWSGKWDWTGNSIHDCKNQLHSHHITSHTHITASSHWRWRRKTDTRAPRARRAPHPAKMMRRRRARRAPVTGWAAPHLRGHGQAAASGLLPPRCFISRY